MSYRNKGESTYHDGGRDMRKVVIDICLVMAVMSLLLALATLAFGSTAAQDAETPQCKVVGAQLVAYEYSPVTGVARATYTHAVGGEVSAEGYGRADLSMTQNNAERKARIEVLDKICRFLTDNIRKKTAEKIAQEK